MSNAEWLAGEWAAARPGDEPREHVHEDPEGALWGNAWHLDVTDKTVDEIVMLVRNAGRDTEKVTIEYGGCGSHEVHVVERARPRTL